MGTHLLSNEDIQSIYDDRARYLMIARSYVRDVAVSEDIFHDSMLFVLQNRDTLEIQNIRSYFVRMIISRCLNYLKQNARQGEIREGIRQAILEFESVDINSGKSGDRMALMSEVEDRLKECRNRLSPLCFDIFLASRISGLSHKEIADKFGISARRVNTEIQKALEVFRSEFKDYISLPAFWAFFIMGATGLMNI